MDKEHISNFCGLSLLYDKDIFLFMGLPQHQSLLSEEIELLLVHGSIDFGIDFARIIHHFAVTVHPLLHQQLEILGSAVLGLIAHVLLVLFVLFLCLLLYGGKVEVVHGRDNFNDRISIDEVVVIDGGTFQDEQGVHELPLTHLLVELFQLLLLRGHINGPLVHREDVIRIERVTRRQDVDVLPVFSDSLNCQDSPGVQVAEPVPDGLPGFVVLPNGSATMLLVRVIFDLKKRVS